jgi:hypothetical protein
MRENVPLQNPETLSTAIHYLTQYSVYVFWFQFQKYVTDISNQNSQFHYWNPREHSI